MRPAVPKVKPEDDYERAWMVAISPDGRQVLAGGHDGQIAVWDGDAGPTPVGRCGESCSCALAFVPGDSHYALSGDGDGLIRLWNLDEGTGVWADPVKHNKNKSLGLKAT